MRHAALKCFAEPAVGVALLKRPVNHALTCCFHFSNGMADLVPGSGIGEKPSCIRPIFGSEGTKLTNLFCITTDGQIRVAVLYFGFQVNIALVVPMLYPAPFLVQKNPGRNVGPGFLGSEKSLGKSLEKSGHPFF